MKEYSVEIDERFDLVRIVANHSASYRPFRTELQMTVAEWRALVAEADDKLGTTRKGYDLCPPGGCPEHRPRKQGCGPLRRADGG